MFEIYNEADEIFGGLVLESANKDKAIFEEAADIGLINDFAAKQIRAQAMSCVLGWIEAGDYSYDALADSAATISDLDGDEEFTDDEEEYYNELLVEVGNALVALGAAAENVETFIDSEDSEEGAKLGAYLAEKMATIEDDDDTLISNFAVTEGQVMESVVKVIRGGKVAFKKKRIRRVKLSAAQKAGLKKARRKAFTGAAKLKRAKSMKIRRNRGM